MSGWRSDEYLHPEVGADEYNSNLTTRECVAIALAVMAGAPVSEIDKRKASGGLKVFQAQRGCEHMEGFSGLPETCDVYIFG